MSDAPDTKDKAGTRSCLAIILAAGEGTRMKSATAKVLHRIAGRSMLGHVLAALGGAGAGAVTVVVGPDRDDVATEALAAYPGATVAVQRERLGTAHAVLSARDAIGRGFDDVVVAYGDVPLVGAGTFAALRGALAGGAAVAVLGFRAANPTGYGRLLTDGDRLVAIREEKDASPDERGVTLVNSGLLALRGDVTLSLLDAVGNANQKGEYYLTDAVEIAVARGLATAFVLAPETETMGVNDRAQLAAAERVFQDVRRAAAMRDGVTLVAPNTVWFSADTRLARDVIVEPNVWFGPGVTVEEGATVRAFSHLEGATVGAGSTIGPFARLRPGARLGPDVHIGNFVEVKNAVLAAGVKANHLAYLGDATIGERTNVGAGTITCNYDGAAKHRTTIGRDAFIGSNTSLVAPITVGDGAYVGSGSVLTDDVPADALGLGRARQAVLPGWARTRRPQKTKKP